MPMLTSITANKRAKEKYVNCGVQSSAVRGMCECFGDKGIQTGVTEATDSG